MALFRVYYDQVNSGVLLISAKDEEEAFRKAKSKIAKLCPDPSTIESVDTGKATDCSDW